MRKLLAEVHRGANEDRVILAGAFAIWIVLLALLWSKGVNGLQLYSYGANLLLYLSALLYFLVFAGAPLLLRHRPDRPIAFLAGACMSSGLAHKLARGTPMLLALVIFMPAFSAMKSAIPLFNSYAWDTTWIQLDRAIHGTDPWRILQPILGWPVVTSLLSVFYHLWLLLLYAGEIWFCFFLKDQELRARFFVANFASWTLLGTLMAVALASVGPSFLAPLRGDHRFDEQMAYLRAANEQLPVLTVMVQDRLIAWYTSGSEGLGRGISAMPSMHVSFSFLFFLAIRRVSRLAGLCFGLFCAVILIASVHLGYHYAVDGYVSIAGTWAIWLASGAVVRRISRTQISQEAGCSVPSSAPANAAQSFTSTTA